MLGHQVLSETARYVSSALWSCSSALWSCQVGSAPGDHPEISFVRARPPRKPLGGREPAPAVQARLSCSPEYPDKRPRRQMSDKGADGSGRRAPQRVSLHRLTHAHHTSLQCSDRLPSKPQIADHCLTNQAKSRKMKRRLPNDDRVVAPSDKDNARNKARRRASREHQGPNHWHVERRSTVIICGHCEAKIPLWKNPQYCPECEEGKR